MRKEKNGKTNKRTSKVNESKTKRVRDVDVERGDRQTDKETDRQTQFGRQIWRGIRQSYRQTDSVCVCQTHIDKDGYRETERQSDRQKERQVIRETDTSTLKGK